MRDVNSPKFIKLQRKILHWYNKQDANFCDGFLFVCALWIA